MCFNAKTGAWQFSATANLLPGKHVFDHSVDYTERFTASASAEVDATQGNLSGTISIVNNNPTLGSFDVVISNVKAPNGVETVSVPIWSEINGQDDIIWYTANRQNSGTYTVNVKASAHKNSTGLYNIHLYYVQKDGQLTGVGGTTTQVFIGKTPEQLKPKANFAIENNNAKAGTFDAVITNISAPLGVKEVLVPSWSLENGQDDLIWHKATKQTDGSYRVTIKASEHKGIKRNYRADAYIVDNSNNRHYIAEKVVAVDYARPSGVLTIENNNTAAGTFDAVVRNIVAPTGLKEVLVPSWSLAGGQDDLIWHKATRQADGSYRVTIKATDHKNSTGKYRADAYLVDDFNKRFYLTEKVVEVTQTRPSASLFIENNNADLGTFDAVIRNIVAPNGVKEVLVPSWSLVNGQDDLVWHKASRQSDGSYRVTIKSSEHKNSLGNYRADVYIVDNANQRHYVTETIVDVKHNKPVGTISVVNNNNDTGTFDVFITNLTNPSGISGVVIPVWSEQNGQDDLVWHNATKQDDGSYKVTISASQHKWNSGKYVVHGYIVDASGKNIGFGATSADVVAPKKIGSASRGNYDVLNKIVYLDAGHGGYDPGASYFGISEKSLTLAIQSRVKAKLESEGYQVVTTRTSDTYVDLTDRSRAANASESDIFVSIHINASGSSAAQGIETYYYQPYAEYPSRINATYHANPTRLSMSDTLANAIQSSLINATGAQNQGVKRQTFAVLRETTAPAVLLELGFLSNPQEAARLSTSAYQETLANAIVAGIKRYYSIYN